MGNGCYNAKINCLYRRDKGQYRRMCAHTAVVTVFKRQVAIAIFSTVLFFYMTAGIMLYQVIVEIALVVMGVKVVVIMCEEFRQPDELFCK